MRFFKVECNWLFYRFSLVCKDTELENGWGWQVSLEVICSSRDSWSTPPRTMSKHLFKISKETPQSVGHLRQCSVTCTVNKCFLMFGWNLTCSSLCPWLLVLELSTVKKSLALSSLQSPFRYMNALLSSSPGWAVPALSAAPHRRGASVPSSSRWPCAGLSHMSMSLSYWGSQNSPALQRQRPQSWAEGRTHHPCAMYCTECR